MGEASQVTDVTGVSLDTSDFIRINTQTNGSRARDHSGNHRLRETGQGANHAASNTACGTNPDATAEFVTNANHVANDDIKKARGLHDADEDQNTGHIGNHRVQTRVNQGSNCCALSDKRNTGDNS